MKEMVEVFGDEKKNILLSRYNFDYDKEEFSKHIMNFVKKSNLKKHNIKLYGLKIFTDCGNIKYYDNHEFFHRYFDKEVILLTIEYSYNYKSIKYYFDEHTLQLYKSDIYTNHKRSCLTIEYTLPNMKNYVNYKQIKINNIDNDIRKQKLQKIINRINDHKH